MRLTKNDVLDHHYWLIGCNVEKIAMLDGKTAQYAMETNIIDIRYHEQVERFIKTFMPEMPIHARECEANDTIELHRKGKFFRYTVTRN